MQRNVKKHKITVHDGVKCNCDRCEYKGTQQNTTKTQTFYS